MFKPIINHAEWLCLMR